VSIGWLQRCHNPLIAPQMTDNGAGYVREPLAPSSTLDRNVQLQLLRRPVAWMHPEFMNDETELPVRRNPVIVQRERQPHRNIQPTSLGGRNGYGGRPVAVEEGIDLGERNLPLKRDAPALIRVLDVNLSGALGRCRSQT